MATKNIRTIFILSLLLAASLAVVSYSGAFIPSTYERDATSMGAQGAGQDLVDLLIVLPLLIISLIFLLKENRIAYFLFGGTVFYILYSFVIYCFGVHFNRLFLLYCSTFGLALYTFILFMIEFSRKKVEDWFEDRVPVKFIGFYFIVIAAIFYILWLRDIVPALVTNTIPKAVEDYGLLVNPVHVLDIAVALPGLVVAAVLLMKRHPLGFILAPIALVFLILLAIALIGMVMMVDARGISEDASIAVIFAVIAVISTLFLILFLKPIRPEND